MFNSVLIIFGNKKQYYYQIFCIWNLSKQICNSVPDSFCETVNLLWPRDTIWWHRSGSTLAQVMACCLTATNHYLNQCWLLICEGFFCICLRAISQWLLTLLFCIMSLNIILVELLPYFPGANELNHIMGGHMACLHTIYFFSILYHVCIFANKRTINPSSDSSGFIQNPNFFFTTPADTLAPLRARTSASTMLTVQSEMFSYKSCWFWWVPITIYSPDDVIQNGQLDLKKSCFAFSLNIVCPGDAIWWHRFGSTLAQLMA